MKRVPQTVGGDDRNQDPGMVVDYQTRKKLKNSEKRIAKNNKMAYISIFLEVVVFVVLIVAWTSLKKM